MDKQDILNTIKSVRENSPKRKFTQNFDIIINLKNIDFKKEDQKINTFLSLPHSLGKKIRTTALIGQELVLKAKESCNKSIVSDDFKKLDKKSIKKLSEETDFFIAQANIMPQVAAAFGKILGPRGKMPNPKAGCVVPPTADLKPIVDKLQKTIRLETKNEPVIKSIVGTENLKDEQLAENILSIYNNLLTILPQEKNNIKNIILKLTMGKSFVIQEKEKKIKK